MARDNKKSRKSRVRVVSRHGTYRFQTGMVTADLLARGIPMQQAFPLAGQVRDRVSGRASITTEELAEVIDAVLDEAGWSGARGTSSLPDGGAGDDRGLLDRPMLARDFHATALSVGAVQALLDEVARQVEAEGLDVRDEAVLYPRIDRELEARFGEEAVRRYRLARWVRTADKPVIIFIGGATGTGKSTLATELAFRLGIRLATSTDMIRETMRAVLSPEVTPGLHAHSFRGLVEGGALLSDPRERVLAGFHQQAAQVAVGIRAVVRRAVREGQHLIIEGTHLLPPFQDYLPPGAAVHAAGFVMAVPDEARHLARFPRRARDQRLRDPAPYLDAFQSVRWIHDDLLAAAEDAEAVVLSSGPIDQTVNATLEYLSQVLGHQDEDRWLGLGVPRARPPEPGMRTLFIVLDGLSDEPCPQLEGRTPLAAAATPTLARLAGHGGQGLVRTRPAEGQLAQTGGALWRLLGQTSALPAPGRGLLEALGRGVPLPPGSVVFRGNLATVDDDGAVRDRRAGRIRHGVASLLAGLRDVRLDGGIRGSITPGHEHRVIVSLRGPGLSDAVTDTDPGRTERQPRVLRPRPLDDSPEAARAALALGQLLDIARRHLAGHPVNEERAASGLPVANAVLTRGAARVHHLAGARPRAERMAVVASCTTALGVARALGMQAVTDLRMTGNADTDIGAKLDVAAALMDDWSTVVVHLKAPDILAHDRDPVGKRDFIRRFDRALGDFLSARPALAERLRIVVTGDHGTSSRTGEHLPDDVPVLLATWAEDSDPAAFDEESAQHGALGLLTPDELAALLWAE
ncbi:MAG: hypothetical protein D6798_07905 [Deltaproteobacteria bacterium]|nr:MAG: hypothetical protein D6798_07905 [Deltaproteobacteria bacterium]